MTSLISALAWCDRATSAHRRQVLVIAYGVALAFVVTAYWWRIGPFTGGDGATYLQAGRDALSGDDLYSRTETGGIFGFLYPPFAALSFTPLAWLAPATALSVWQSLIVVALFVVVWLVARHLSPTSHAWWPLVAVVLMAWYPVTRNLAAGQIDLVLMVLVLADLLLLRGTRWHGVLLGLAAGVKLTPAGYLLVLLIRRDWRSALRLVITTLTTIAAAWLVLPKDSGYFWFHMSEVTGRSGNQSQALSQCWAAFVARMQRNPDGMVSGGGTYLWLALVVLTVVVGVLAIRAALAKGDWLLAIGANAAVNLLISPLSTMHHWVAALPLFAALLARALKERSGRAMAWVAVGAVLTGLQSWWYLGGAFTWGLAKGVIGSSLVYWAVATLLLLSRHRRHD